MNFGNDFWALFDGFTSASNDNTSFGILTDEKWLEGFMSLEKFGTTRFGRNRIKLSLLMYTK